MLRSSRVVAAGGLARNSLSSMFELWTALERYWSHLKNPLSLSSFSVLLQEHTEAMTIVSQYQLREVSIYIYPKTACFSTVH